MLQLLRPSTKSNDKSCDYKRRSYDRPTSSKYRRLSYDDKNQRVKLPGDEDSEALPEEYLKEDAV